MVELLAVIGIISIMAVMIGVALSGGGQAVALGNGQRVAASIFQSARSVAVLRQTQTRVIIYADQGSSTDPRKFLRYMGVVYEEPLGSDNWVPVNTGTYLPEGVFFIPETIPSGLDASEAGGSLMRSSVNDTFSVSFPTTGQTADAFYYYQFDSNGMSDNPGGTFVINGGRMASDFPVEVAIENPFLVAGFAIRRMGSVTLFNDWDEINAIQ